MMPGPAPARRLERRKGGKERPEIERVERQRSRDDGQLAGQHQVERARAGIAVERDLRILEAHALGVPDDVGFRWRPRRSPSRAAVRFCDHSSIRRSDGAENLALPSK